jgi:WD40 repeat protein
VSIGNGEKTSTVQFHSHARDVISSTTAAATGTPIDIYSLQRPSTPILSLQASSPSKSHCWSPLSGSTLLSYSTTNTLSLYDPRVSPTPQTTIQPHYTTTRPSHTTFLSDTTILATGTTPSTRTLTLWDLRSPLSANLTVPFDPTAAPSVALVPLTDPSRNLAYIVQKHSSSIFAFDFNGVNPVATTLQVPSTIVDAAVLPGREIDVMRAEINRVFVLTRRDEIIPVSVRVERKVHFPPFLCFSLGVEEGADCIELLGFS